MSTFDNNSLKKVTIKFTTTDQCSTSKTIKSNSYLISISFHNDTAFDNFSNTTYGVYLPSIDNEWEDYARKGGEEYLNINHSRSTKQILNRHAHKFNEIFFRTKPFEHQCVLLYPLLNQGELAAHCSFIGLNDANFNLHCLSNEKRLFY